MGNSESTVACGDIKLVSPYGIIQLDELKIVKRMNEHAVLYFSGVIPEENKDGYIEKATVDDQIEVVQTDGGSTVRTLFKGLVSNLLVRCIRGVYHLEAEALSYTCMLDVKRKFRSFQNKDMTVKDLVSKVMADYSGADFQDTATNGGKLGEFTVQYDETDWVFLKRMASRSGSVLTPQADSDKPKFWFGLPNGKDKSFEDGFNYIVHKDISKYLDLSGNADKCPEEHEFTYFEVESTCYLDLGDKVKINEKNLMAVKSTAVLKNGILTFVYVLAPENGMKQGRFNNTLIIGASMEGKVIELKGDTLKVELDIDKDHKSKPGKAESCFFRYTTSYTAEGNSGWYCMPQPGDSVKLYVPNAVEESAVVMSSVRKGGQSNPKTGKPGMKYFQTNYGKHMKLGETDVEFTAMEGAMHIILDEGKGIDITSSKSIMIQSEKDIVLDAKSISITAVGESIGINCSGSSISMDGDTHVKGSIVKAVGTNKAPMSLGDVLNMVKATVMMPIDTAKGVVAMGAMVGNAASQGTLGQTCMGVVTSVPAVAGAVKVTGMDSQVETNTVMAAGKGKTGIRGVQA